MIKKFLRVIISKYSHIPVMVKASLWFTICNMIQKGISLACTPIFTRLLTTQEYGTYSIYQSWLSILQVFATLNLFYGAFNNGMIKYEKKKFEYISSIQSLITCLTFLLLIVYLLNESYWNKILGLSSIFVYFMFIDVLFVSSYNLWAAEQRYEFKYKKLVVITVIMAFLSPIIAILAVISTNYKAEARVFSFVMVQTCVGLFFYIMNLKKGKIIYNKEFWIFALKFNLPLVPHYLSQTILNQADRIMIRHLIGNTEAAIYSVAYSIAMMMTIVTNAINNSFVPYAYKEIKKKNYQSLRKNANFILLLVGIICVISTAFAPEIIGIFATKDYYDAIWIMPPVAISVYFIFLYTLFGNIEFYYEKTKFIMIASCFGAIVNIILNYIFIPIFGYYVAGYTTLFCYILFAIAHYTFYKNILKNYNDGIKIYDVNIIIAISIAIIILMLLMTLLYNYLAIRYFMIFCFAIFIVFKRKKIKILFYNLKRR